MSLVNKKNISYLIFVIKIVIGICLCIFIFRINSIQIGDLFNKQAFSLMLILIFYQIVILILSGIRWILIVRSLTDNALTFRNGLRITWIGQFFSSFLPSIMSTDAARFYYINQIHPGFKDNAKTIIADRVVALLSLIILSLACLISYLRAWSIIQYIIFSLAAFAILIIITSNVNGIKKIPVHAYIISYLTFNIKAFSLLTVILFLETERAIHSDFYLAMFGQIFEVIPLTPANIGVGHIVYDLIYDLKPGILGAVVYNYYFFSKLIVKFSGIIAWARFGLLRRDNFS